MTKPSLRSALLAGFAFTGLAYGGVLSLLHATFNRLGSAPDAVVVLAVCALLYGLWGAASWGLGWAVARWRLRGLPGNAPFLGLCAFQLIFWEAAFLYGLTYEQVPFFGAPAGPWGMTAFLAAAALLIAAAVALVSWALARAGAALGRRRLAWAAWSGAALLLGVHLAAPLWAGGETPGSGGAAHAAEAVETDGADEAGGESEATAPPPFPVQEGGLKVVLVGLDGADWRVIDPMIEAGELPTFARLVREGARASLETLPDANSAVIWASLYTGMAPGRHGVHDFYRIELPAMASGGIFPVHRTFFKELAGYLETVGLARRTTVSRYSLRAAPLWEIADRGGLSLGMVDGYFFSFPALEPSATGSFFLSYGLDGFDQRLGDGSRPGDLGLFVQPEELFRRVRPLLGRGDFYWQSEALLDLLSDRPQPRFVNLYTHEPDSVQHRFWKWHEPERYLAVSKRDVEEKGDAIRRLHRDFDAFLARLLDRLEPGTVLVVASDHGHVPTLVHRLYTQHRHGPAGILLMHGGPVAPGAELTRAHVYDLFPTLLYLLGLPVPEDAPGEILAEGLSPQLPRARPPARIPTYEGLWPDRWAAGETHDGARNRQELEKLRSLGYI